MAQALALFRRHGYESVLIADLTKDIGIAPPSLYAAFGSKAGLFEKALALYVRESGARTSARLKAARTLDQRVRALLEDALDTTLDGIRPSPVSPANGISCSDPQVQFDFIVGELDKLGIAYIHVAEGATGGPRDVAPFDFAALRKAFRNTYIANNGYDLVLACTHLRDGEADLVAFGRPFIANPDLVERLKTGTALSAPNPQTIYGGGAEG